ncbi:MAG: SPOR domain-containing protein [Methyloceanibacter sp.]|uniref:SPOR domain-containing protein n=1 Tax=Methyloceanibacter sp. TaxID=1965321 RepID=UPI003D6D612F
MADHRKSFRPRHLAFGGGLLLRRRLAGAAFALLGLLAAAHAQDAGLKTGADSLAAGKYDTAVRQLSATVNNENVSAGQAAKALYLRGIAYRKLGQPARAISDLGAAIWLGLTPSDKVRALVNRGLAYKAAGLSSQGDAELALARKASSTSEVDKLIAEDGAAAVAAADPGSFATAVVADDQSSSGESVWSRLVPSFGGSSSSPPPAPPPAAPPPRAAPAPAPASPQTAAAAPSSGWDASVSDTTSEPSGGGNRVSRWFGSLTGDSAPAPAPAPDATAPAPAPRTTTAPPKTAAAPPSAASWAANTETTKVVSEGSDGGGGTAIGRWFSRSSESAPAAPQAASAGRYRIQLANSRSQAEAEALWKQVSRANGQLASAQPQIEKVDIGSFGTFYSLKFGQFGSQEEGARVCNALKRSGTDCSVVSPDGP